MNFNMITKSQKEIITVRVPEDCNETDRAEYFLSAERILCARKQIAGEKIENHSLIISERRSIVMS